MTATTRAAYVTAATNVALSTYNQRLTRVRAIWAEQDTEALLTGAGFQLATAIVAGELIRLEHFLREEAAS